MRLLPVLLTATALFAPLAMSAAAAEHRVRSPDGKLALVVSDDAGLRYRVELDGKPLLADSVLGLDFADGTTLGPAAKITGTKKASRKATWDNPLGQRRTVPDRFRELRITLNEGTALVRTFALVARAYDHGVAFRYDLPEASGLGEFTLKRELTEFRFLADHRAWPGDESGCAENSYYERKLSEIPRETPQSWRAGQPYLSVLPLLVETPSAYVAVAESDLLDWAGLFLTGTGETAVRAELAGRQDGRGEAALTWNASPTATGYTVQRSTTSGGTYTSVANLGNVLSHTDTGLADETTYYYVVVPVNAGGNGPASAEASATTEAVVSTGIAAWRQAHFGTTDATGDFANDADPDADGVANLLEYALGGDPMVAENDLLPVATVVDGKLTLSFDRIDDPTLLYEVLATDYSENGVGPSNVIIGCSVGLGG